ncbi:MAG: endoribonuclease MazF [Symbiobacteriia bacterium]
MVNQTSDTEAYLPERGDIVWLQFDPQAGHEQAGRRPALVVSPSQYNGKVGLALMCPITSKAKGYPFEVVLPGELSVFGVILADQIKNLDWRVRQAQFECQAPAKVVAEVLDKIQTLLF